MKELSKRDILDILNGSVILGTGGGGSMDKGVKLIEQAESLDKKFYLVAIEEVLDDSMIFTPYGLGSISETPNEELVKYEGLQISDEEPILVAVTRMEKYIDKKMYASIACETGGFNTALSLYVAAMKDGFFLDADLAGRAVPEVQNSTYYIHNLPASPIVVTNEFGEIAIYENIKDDQRSEVLLRALSKVSNNYLAVVDHALDMKKLRHAIIPGTISKALDLGRIYRLAKKEGGNVPQKLAKAAGGIVVFKGTISSFEWKTFEGFTQGHFIAKGKAGNERGKLKVWFKNENLMSWFNDEVFITLPDLICIFDSETNEPVTNPNYRNGMNIVIIAYPAPLEFTTKRGLEAFGPKSFGFNIEYVPAIGRVQSL